MYYIYILKSAKDGSIYIGFSSDLRKRFYEHNAGKVKSTKKRKPWKLIYYEAYLTKQDAVYRERMLKLHAKGLAQLKRRIKYSLSKDFYEP